MTREVDLVSYLPPFMAEFKEIAVTLEAENPEFVLVWNAAERVLQNEFIETADEYGISRFEKILNILPSIGDNLEDRRARVQSRWQNVSTFTQAYFAFWLNDICGRASPTLELVGYVLHVGLPIFVDYLSILDRITRYVPANIHVNPTILLSKETISHYIGACIRYSTKQIIKTATWNTDNIYLLTDEEGNSLIDGVGGLILFEEGVS